MTLMEEQIFRESGICNEIENKRKGKTLAKRDAQSKSNGGGGLTVLQQCIQRLTQRTVKFIRWLKNQLDSERSWQHALAILAKIYAAHDPKVEHRWYCAACTMRGCRADRIFRLLDGRPAHRGAAFHEI